MVSEMTEVTMSDDEMGYLTGAAVSGMEDRCDGESATHIKHKSMRIQSVNR